MVAAVALLRDQFGAPGLLHNCTLIVCVRQSEASQETVVLAQGPWLEKLRGVTNIS